MRRVLLLTLLFLGSQFTMASDVIVASKKFTESVILGEIATGLIDSQGIPVKHKKELGLSQILWKALLRGHIDVYPEYTGTLTQELLRKYGLKNDEELRQTLKADFGIGMTAPLGFTNTFALGVPKALIQKLGISKVSDLLRHPELRFGFSHEFIHRPEGWPSLKTHYGFQSKTILGIEHEISYRAIQENTIDVTDTYSTDAEIQYHNLQLLVDDLHHFPEYQAVYLYRLDLLQRVPTLEAILKRLENKLPQEEMISLNKKAKFDRLSEKTIANQFLTRTFDKSSLTPHVDTRDYTSQSVRTNEASPLGQFLQEDGLLAELYLRSQEHLLLVGISLGLSILFAIPLGILASKAPKWGSPILWTAGIVQTIPSIALLVFMIPIFGIGKTPAIAALFLYGLLPIIRNTHSGIMEIPETIQSSAIGLGLSSWQILRMIELPMASRSIFAGIKTSAVISVGTATLGSIIGAGGLGQQILTGVRRDDLGVILSGAIPAAFLAIGVQLIFDAAEKKLYST